ncbi:ComEC/Rec2 family competence protein [Psychrobacter phenylpyruvicus]|uniref:ComEC family competence protein n=1 Tax=Psychrobacter phenylpyruvicus TaxID=29432 RepID=A0A379LI84_9GAMM|nr:ComEC/Rec2 family competence protein [Psychrobacter phenylpyruvicus]SUD90273.1 ComEC family competence protein [Psychrobacter phenylpyruvicus]
MIWLAGILAIALMLAILELDPSQLYALSNLAQQVVSERWQVAAYVLLALMALLCSLSYLAPLSFRILKRNTSPYSASSISIIPTQIYLTPYTQLRRQGLFTPIIKLAILLLLLLAVLSNSVAQRLAFIESSPQKPLYLEAMVSPVGLSDKRLAVAKGEVIQGYRQLVQLSAIQLDSLHNNKSATAPDLSGLSKLPATMQVMLQSYQSEDSQLNQLAPNQQLRMKLVLQPLELKDKTNADEFDEYRWLSSRHATAKAFIVEASYLSIKLATELTLQQKIDVMRYKFREHFLKLMLQRSQQTGEGAYQITDSQDEVAVTLSLLTGDRSLISDDMTALYQFGGISHLLAISGTHVLFLSLLCAALAMGVINRFRPSIYHWLPRWQCAFIIAAITAFGYALFAGFDVPALRTACMLLLVGVVRYFLAVPAIFKMLLVLAVAMAWADVFVLWQAGFWLSFVAVAVLVAYSQRWQRVEGDRRSASLADKVKQRLISLMKLQIWMSVALLPISLWLFGKVSLWGFVINLFAIGLFGSIIVPINLLASVLFVMVPANALSAVLWSLLFWILAQLHTLLQLLQQTFQQSGWLYSEMSLPFMGLLLLTALPWILPKSMLSRALCAVPVLAITAMIYASEDLPKDSVHITVLNPKNFNYAANLIQHKQQAWLLLSSYENQYKTVSEDLALKQQAQLSQDLYDQLKQQNVEQLTGVIVQTATINLAPVVASLSQYLPISYYWQAGLSAHKLTIDKALAGSSLQAQSCQATKHWPAYSEASPLNAETELEQLSISALTGWEQVEDSRVWDCAIQISSSQAIYLSEQGQTEQLFVATERRGKTNMTKGKTHIKSIDTDVQELNLLNKAVIYSSANPQLAQLWQLMCDARPQPRSSGFESLNIDKGGYWLTSSQSVVKKSMVDNFLPQQWRIIGEGQASATLPLQESHLYWQQP